jgi:hypothetical protein
MNPVLIKLDVEFKYITTPLDVVVKLDDDVILAGPQTEVHKTIVIDTEFAPGDHKLTIELLNKNYNECTETQDAAVIINSVRFQHLDNEFKYNSWYRPTYPADWSGERTTVVHSNYMGWNGCWGIDFSTPIYPWLHKQLNLGWLL